MSKFNLRRLLLFSAAGTINTAVCYGGYVALVLLDVHYNVALAGEYILGVVLGFLLNRWWTFSDRIHLELAFPKFLATYFLVFLVNLVFLNIFVRLGIHPMPAQAVALMLATSASYLLQKHWVFRCRGRERRKLVHAALTAAEEERPVVQAVAAERQTAEAERQTAAVP